MEKKVWSKRLAAAVLSMVVMLSSIGAAPAAFAADGGSNAKVVQIASGFRFSLALMSDGTVWLWGRPMAFRDVAAKPVQVEITNVRAISAGEFHAVALKNDGTVWTWGSNDYAELGDGTVTRWGPAPDKPEGWLTPVDDQFKEKPVQVKNLTDVTAIAAGGNGNLALKADGTVWEWGRIFETTYGQLMASDPVDSKLLIPSQVAGVERVIEIYKPRDTRMGLAVTDDRSVWGWGPNTYGLMGVPDQSDGYFTKPELLPNLLGGDKLSFTKDTLAAARPDGTFLESGKELMETTHLTFTDYLKDRKSIPHHETPAINELLAHFTKVTDSSEFAFSANRSFAALKDDGTVWTWGDNSLGQSGDGTFMSHFDRMVQVKGISGIVDIAGNAGTVLALDRNGSVWSWGSNLSGQLGDGTENNRNTPLKVLLGTQGSADEKGKAAQDPAKPAQPQQPAPSAPLKVSINGKTAAGALTQTNKGLLTLSPQSMAKALGTTIKTSGNVMTVTRGKLSIRLTAGQAKAAVKGKPIVLPQPAYVANKLWYVPAEWYVKALGGTFKYDAGRRTLQISIK